MTGQRQLFYYCLALLLAVAGFLLIHDAAFAQAMGTAGGGFSCSDGRASGSLYDSGGSCPTSMQIDNLFSFVVCNMEQLSSNLLGNMYCGMILNLMPAVVAVLTFAVVIFGLAFTIGVVPATAREFQLFLLKIAFVFTFATQADYLIGVAYHFLITGIHDGVSIILSGYFPRVASDGSETGTASSGADMYQHLDKFLGQVIKYATDYMGSTGLADSCKNAVFVVIAVMMVAFPPMSYLALLILAKIALTFLRAVFGYIYALVGIAFLMTLSPFFLSFYLFRQTRNLFDKWVGYLVSFTLQIVLLFAFLSFVLSINISSITSSFTDIIVPVQETHEGTAFRMPWQYCTICEFKAVYKDGGGEIPETNSSDFVSKGKLMCKESPGKPITLTSASAPEGGGAPSNTLVNSLIKFTFTGLMSLFVLAYVVDSLLRQLPSLAQFLGSGMGGSSYAPQLGGGYNPRGLDTVDIPLLGGDNEGVIKNFGDGFQRGFSTSKSWNSLSAVKDGIAGGTGLVVRGDETHAGLEKSFLNWLSDPNH